MRSGSEKQAASSKSQKAGIAQLSQHLGRCPLPTAESSDLEQRFQTLLTEYSAQFGKFEDTCAKAAASSSSTAVVGAGPGPRVDAVLRPTPGRELPQVSGMFHEWRSSYASGLTDLDSRLSELRLSAERMHIDVEQTLVPQPDIDNLREMMHHNCLRRVDALRCQCAMLVGRLRSCHRAEQSSSARQVVVRSPVCDVRLRVMVDAAWNFLNQEMKISEKRVFSLRPNAEPLANTREVAWSGPLLAILRRELTHDVSSKTLCGYLQRLQYIGFTHRSKIWRRALELKAVMELPAPGESADSGLCQPCRVPTATRSKAALEAVLEELGPVFGCSVSLKSDKGRSFAHQVAVDFASIFEKQQKQLSFKFYPAVSNGSKDADMQQQADGPRSSIHERDNAALSSIAQAEVDVCYIRPSEWVRYVRWQPRVNPDILEQALLLKASYARTHTPVRMVHGKPSYARQLLENVSSSAGAPQSGDDQKAPQWDPDVDAMLSAEKAFLQVGDVKTVVRRLNETGRSPHEQSLDAADADEQAKLPQPLVRAYALLRHLQCRAQRKKLLDLLNFFRFVQRRLVAGLVEECGAIPPCGKEGSVGGKRSKGSHQAKMKWDLSPGALSNLCAECPLPSVTGQPEVGDKRMDGPPPLDRESLLRLSSDEVVVVSDMGLKVIHAASLEDLDSLEREMLSIGSYYIHKYEASASGANIEKPLADRAGVLLDLYNAEVWLNTEKSHLLEIYLEIYEHTSDPLEKRDLSQRMIDVMAVRPRLDLNDAYFTDTYAVSISVFDARTALLRPLLTHQIHAERALVKNKQKMHKTTGAHVTDASDSANLRGSFRRSVEKEESSSEDSSVEDDDAVPPTSSMADPLEGYKVAFPIEAPMILPTPNAEQVGIDEFCESACLTWKAELWVEEVHRDLVKHLHPPSGQLTSMLERSCYMAALELWKESERDESFWKHKTGPYEDPELLLLIVKETATKMNANPLHARIHADDPEDPRLVELGGLDFDGQLHHAYNDLRRRCGNDVNHLIMHTMGNLLDHVYVRRQLCSAVIETVCLERAISAQGVAAGTRIEHARPPALLARDSNLPAPSSQRGNAWIDRARPVLSAGMLEIEMGHLELNTAKGLAMQIAPVRLQELRGLLQHELAYRSLVLACVQHNALLLDPMMRSKEMADVAVAGPSRDLISGSGHVTDPGATMTRRLRQSASLAGTKAKCKAKPTVKPKGVESQGIQDFTRYLHLLQAPAKHLEPIRKAMLPIVNNRATQLRNAGLGLSEQERQVRFMMFQSLTACSLAITRTACDLSVRVQAAEASTAFRAVASLIPSKLSPFDRFNEQKRQLVEKDGFVGSVFAVPFVLDVLQLKAVLPDPDLDSTLEGIVSVLMPSITKRSNSKEQPMITKDSVARRPSMWTASDESLPEVQAVNTDGEAGQIIPRLEIEYEGPASITLRILHELTGLVQIHYCLATIDADPLTLLRMQRFVRLSFMELDGSTDVVGKTLSRTEPTFEALEQLHSSLSQLAHRLDALGDNVHDPDKVLQVLHTEVRSAYRELALLLRISARGCLEDNEVEDFAELSGWSRYLEQGACGVDTSHALVPDRGLSRQKVEQSFPLASLMTFAKLQGCKDSAKVSALRDGSDCTSTAAQARTEPEVTSSHSDNKRYVSELHPEMHAKHQLLNPFMRAILASYESSSASSDSHNAHGLGTEAKENKSSIPAPAQSRVPGHMPPAPYLALASALCSLSVQRRQKISRMRNWIYERRVSFHVLHQVQPKTDRSVEADTELLGTLLLLDMLREHVVAGQLGEATPASRNALHRFELHHEAHFGPDAISGGGGGGVLSMGVRPPLKLICSTESCVDEECEPTPDEVRQEVDAALLEITHLATALDRLQLAGACERLGRELAKLAQHRHRIAAVHSSGMVAAVRARPTAKGGGLHSMKVNSILHSLNQLRANSTYVVCPNNDERAYVLKESDLNNCVEDLLCSLTTWGDDIVEGRDRHSSDMAKFLDSRYEALAHELSRNRVSRREDETPLERDARVKVKVADQGCRFVFEVDRLHRVIRDLRTVSQELDYRLSSEIWNKVRDAVTSLSSKLGSEMGQFRESHGNRAATVARQMRKIREHVAGQLADISAENYATQQRAQQARGERRISSSPQPGRWEEDERNDDRSSPLLGAGADSSAKDQDEQSKKTLLVSDLMHRKFRDVARRDDHRLLQLEIQELRNRQVLSRFFHHFKTQAMRQRFEEKMHALRMTLESNKELWERLGITAGRQTEIAHEFAGTAEQMSLAELKIEQLRSQLEINTDARQKLQGWRKNKARQVAQLEQKVRSHQRHGATNVEGMLQDLKDKTQLVQSLRQEREIEDEDVHDAAEKCDSKNNSLRAQLKGKQRDKHAAKQQLEKVRAQVEQGGLSEEARLQLWRGRIADAKSRLASARRENQGLETQAATSLRQDDQPDSESSDEEW